MVNFGHIINFNPKNPRVIPVTYCYACSFYSEKEDKEVCLQSEVSQEVKNTLKDGMVDGICKFHLERKDNSESAETTNSDNKALQ